MPSIAVKGYDEFTIKINKAMMKNCMIDIAMYC